MAEASPQELEKIRAEIQDLRSTFEQMIQFATEIMKTMGEQFDTMSAEFKQLQDRVSVLEQAQKA